MDETTKYASVHEAANYLISNHRISVKDISSESDILLNQHVYGCPCGCSFKATIMPTPDGMFFKMNIIDNQECGEYRKFIKAGKSRMREPEEDLQSGRSQKRSCVIQSEKRGFVYNDNHVNADGIESQDEDDYDEDLEDPMDKEIIENIDEANVVASENKAKYDKIREKQLKEIDKIFLIPKASSIHSEYDILKRDLISKRNIDNIISNNPLAESAKVKKLMSNEKLNLSDCIPFHEIRVSIDDSCEYIHGGENDYDSDSSLKFPLELKSLKMLNQFSGFFSSGEKTHYGNIISVDPTKKLEMIDGKYILEDNTAISVYSSASLKPFILLPNQKVLKFNDKSSSISSPVFFKYFRFIMINEGKILTFIKQKNISDLLKCKEIRIFVQHVSYQLVESASNPDDSWASGIVKFPGTFEFSEDFTCDLNLELRPYQKRSMEWMLSIENPNAKYDEIMMKRGILSNRSEKTMELIPDKLYIHRYNGFKDKPADDMFIDYRGGILADDTGTGKTITMLTLVHASPFKSFDEIVWDNEIQKHYYIPSTATLIIAPPNLIRQWYNECLKLYGKNSGKKIYLFNTVRDYDRLSWNDVLTADIIVVSHRFLSNTNYKKRLEAKTGTDVSVRKHMQKLIASGSRKDFGNQYHWPLDGIYWHRVVYDEIHEIEFRSRACKARIETIRGSWYWGLTGTPAQGSSCAIQNMCQWLNCRNKILNSKDLIEKVIKRNVPNLELPPLSLEEVFITLTNSERALLSSLSSETNENVKTVLQMCSHHQISAPIINVTGASIHNPLTSEQVSAAVQTSRLKRIEDTKIDINNSIQSLNNFMERVERGDFDPEEEEEVIVSDENENPQNSASTVVKNEETGEIVSIIPSKTNVKSEEADQDNMVVKIEDMDDGKVTVVAKKKKEVMTAQEIADRIAYSKDHINSLKSNLTKLKSEFNYFDGMLKLLGENPGSEGEALTCSICLEVVGKDSKKKSCITRCGHVFCYACLVAWKQPKCPTCRSKISMDKDVFVAAPKDEEKEILVKEEESEFLDKNKNYGKYGSKVKKLVEYIIKCTRENSTNRIILFIQFRRLSDLVFAALEEFQIKIVRVHGHIYLRSKAIREFQNSPDIRVIMLSAEDSVSGLNLVEATHIILLHPFYHGKNMEEEAIASEKQGIARAYRSGLTHPLKVVRLVTRGTIEEEMYRERIGKTVFGTVKI